MTLLNNALFVVCFGFFAWQVILILISFGRKDTSIATRTENTDIKNRKLPCLILCPMPGYKNLVEIHENNESYVHDTFGKEDIFANETLLGFKNESRWFVKELQTIFMGRCTMICFKQNVSRMDFDSGTNVTINNSMSYQVFISYQIDLQMFLKHYFVN